MDESKNETLALVLGGHEVVLLPGGYAVGLTRADARFVLFDDQFGAVYPDIDACMADLLSEAPRVDWDCWGLTEAWAIGLATLIGGQAHRRGDDWVVLYQRNDGMFVVIGFGEAELYDRRQHYEGLQREPIRYRW